MFGRLKALFETEEKVEQVIKNNSVRSDMSEKGVYEKSLPPFELLCIKVPAEVKWEASDTFKVEIEASDDMLEALDVEVVKEELCVKISKAYKAEFGGVYINNTNISTSTSICIENNYGNIRVNGINICDGTVLNGEVPSITVYSPSLKAAEHAGSGSIHIDNSNPQHFFLDLSGAVDAHFTGATESVELDVSGSSSVDLNVTSSEVFIDGSGSFGLDAKGVTKQLNISVSGSGDIDAKALSADNVKAKVSGSGSISVTCTDNADLRVSGSGSIRLHGDPKNVRRKVTGSGDIRTI